MGKKKNRSGIKINTKLEKQSPNNGLEKSFHLTPSLMKFMALSLKIWALLKVREFIWPTLYHIEITMRGPTPGR